jgi:hypothetical protein
MRDDPSQVHDMLNYKVLWLPGKETVTIVQEAGCVPGQVWMVAENLALI